ncbi:hypothetical protein [Chitinimonas sp. BJB300]|uniref:hypothetical protein n=1 Tax=Chitinimonas sp. BJB300 TaxID=1559339 RepID=UPI001112C3F7|nr:hypothetical protein [Chitinimonas sp. BJB300]TSJ83299.1 hypothetical protein FG002_021165 [Chitinimonas sp. BJB300]
MSPQQKQGHGHVIRCQQAILPHWIYLYGGAPKNSGPVPTDNGLSVELSKRELVLTENSMGKVELQFPPNIPLASAPEIVSENSLVTVTAERHANNKFTLHIQPQQGAMDQLNPSTGRSLNRIFTHFRTADGKTATAIFAVSIVTPACLPKSYRQLVLLWKPAGSQQRQCLELRGDMDVNPSSPETLVLAPCDGNKPAQLWQQDGGNGRVVSTTGTYCIALDTPPNSPISGIHVRPKETDLEPCRASNTPVMAQWRFEDGKLISVAHPRSALTYTAGEVPALFPIENRPVPWQQWEWY